MEIISVLPRDIWVEIWKFVGGRDMIFGFERVCTAFYHAVQSSRFWYEMTKLHCNYWWDIYKTRQEIISFRRLFFTKSLMIWQRGPKITNFTDNRRIATVNTRGHASNDHKALIVSKSFLNNGIISFIISIKTIGDWAVGAAWLSKTRQQWNIEVGYFVTQFSPTNAVIAGIGEGDPATMYPLQRLFGNIFIITFNFDDDVFIMQDLKKKHSPFSCPLLKSPRWTGLSNEPIHFAFYSNNDACIQFIDP